MRWERRELGSRGSRRDVEVIGPILFQHSEGESVWPSSSRYAVVQQRALLPLSVDRRAVLRGAVFEQPALHSARDARVRGRHARVGDEYIQIFGAAFDMMLHASRLAAAETDDVDPI